MITPKTNFLENLTEKDLQKITVEKKQVNKADIEAIVAPVAPAITNLLSDKKDLVPGLAGRTVIIIGN